MRFRRLVFVLPLGALLLVFGTVDCAIRFGGIAVELELSPIEGFEGALDGDEGHRFTLEAAVLRLARLELLRCPDDTASRARLLLAPFSPLSHASAHHGEGLDGALVDLEIDLVDAFSEGMALGLAAPAPGAYCDVATTTAEVGSLAIRGRWSDGPEVDYAVDLSRSSRSRLREEARLRLDEEHLHARVALRPTETLLRGVEPDLDPEVAGLRILGQLLEFEARTLSRD